jgi:arsenite methyltransferase
MKQDQTDQKIKEAVRQAYGAAARRFVGEAEGASCGCRSCSAPAAVVESPDTVLQEYLAEEDLASRSDSVPVLAQLRPGEVVLDLGSGGGLDCLRAGRMVGPQGRVIGLDMTPEAIRLARQRAKKVGATNVEFRYGEIEDMPLPDASVDVVISNCVINLSPDKDAVFREIYRVLRPGGRMVVHDIVIEGDLPGPIRDSLAAWAGCVAGALQEPDYLERVRAAGFTDVEVVSREYVRISETTAWSLARRALSDSGLPPDALDRTVVNAQIEAHRPG